MAEVARPVLCLLRSSSNIDEDLEVSHSEDLTRSVLGELDGLSALEEEELGRAVGRQERDAEVGEGENGEGGGGDSAAMIRARPI